MAKSQSLYKKWRPHEVAISYTDFGNYLPEQRFRFAKKTKWLFCIVSSDVLRFCCELYN